MSTTTMIILGVAGAMAVLIIATAATLLVKGHQQQHAQLDMQARNRSKSQIVAERIRRVRVPAENRPTGSGGWEEAVTGATRQMQGRRAQ